MKSTNAMGRKSSAKSQGRPTSSTEPPAPGGGRFSSPLIIVGLVAVLGIGGAFAYMRTSGQPNPSTTSLAGAQAVPDVPSTALKPHPQANLPPLPYNPTPARPPDVVRAAYTFAAEHPEVLTYAPCYCGCEHSGHRGNEDCFVTARNGNGDVTDWEPHGAT